MSVWIKPRGARGTRGNINLDRPFQLSPCSPCPPWLTLPYTQSQSDLGNAKSVSRAVLVRGLRQLTHLIQHANVDRERNIRHIAIVQVMVEPHTARRAKHVTKAPQPQKLHFPNLEHQLLELTADEIDLPLMITSQVDAIKMRLDQRRIQ